MAYIYEVSFDIRSNQLSQLDIGAPLERVVGYLRTLLPSEPGYVTSRAMYSLDDARQNKPCHSKRMGNVGRSAEP